VRAAQGQAVFGKAWRAAFGCYDPNDPNAPKIHVDFSDTGELMRILVLGEMDVEGFGKRYFE